MTPDGLDTLASGSGEWALFDVREPGEADAGHIFGATFLPRRQLERRVADLVQRRETTVVLYDEGGPRAGLAADTLERHGYTDVRVLQGGTAAWTRAGRELTRGSNVPSKLFGEEVYERHGVPQLPVTTLKSWQDDGRRHLVCDIRTPDEYAASRIPGARGAFGVDLARVAGDLRKAGAPIVVHCAGRTRSIIACQSLRALGVDDVHALENGTMGWQLAGLALETGAAKGELVPSRESDADGASRARALAESVGVTAIGADDLAAHLASRRDKRENCYIFDVRQLDEFIDGHIDGAIALPGGLAIQRADEFMPVRRACTILVDIGEARACLAGYWLRRMGHSDVRFLQGGLDAWRSSGRALAQGRGRSTPLGAQEAADMPRISPAELASRPGALVLDVDTSRYFGEARVPGAVWLPYGWLETRIGEHVPDRRAAVVLTCHDGVLSGYAAVNLARLGHVDVRVLDGGVRAWAKQGNRIERGWPADLPAPHDLVVPPYQSDLESMAAYLEWEQRLTADRHRAVSNS
ncbi:MAG: rhodanese-like domain-containing protein [Lautropia sp.]